MEAANRFELATDTGQFTPDQLQPATVIALGFQGWAQWLREFLVPFPSLVHDEHIGVVVVALSIRYERPFRFRDATALGVVSTVRLMGGGRLLALRTELEAASRAVAITETTLRVISLGDDDSLAAAPGRLPPHLQREDVMADHHVARLPRPVRSMIGQLEIEGPIAASRHDFTVHRHLCEVADQWSIIHVPSLAAAARETLLLARADDPQLASALGRPFERIDVELGRPLFLFDDAVVATNVYRDGTVFTHRIESDAGVHATIIETLA
jgi:acyl-CoA thioesterase FadM